MSTAERSHIVEGELNRLAHIHGSVAVTGERILELAKKAEFLYQMQDPTEQRRLLETLLSNCTFDRGSVCPTYVKPFDLFARGNETGNWRRGWDSSTFALRATADLIVSVEPTFAWLASRSSRSPGQV